MDLEQPLPFHAEVIDVVTAIPIRERCAVIKAVGESVSRLEFSGQLLVRPVQPSKEAIMDLKEPRRRQGRFPDQSEFAARETVEHAAHGPQCLPTQLLQSTVVDRIQVQPFTSKGDLRTVVLKERECFTHACLDEILWIHERYSPRRPAPGDVELARAGELHFPPASRSVGSRYPSGGSKHDGRPGTAVPSRTLSAPHPDRLVALDLEL